MSHPHPGPLATYNSLTDKHLTGYFSNMRIRRHLHRSGLISRSGRIISEKEYRLNVMRKDHQKYVRECLAQAIFHRVLDMERHHQLEIKRKLENVVRKERVQRIKVERSRRSGEDANLLLSPHPPTAPRNHYRHPPLVDGEQSGHSQLSFSPRPNTAPENMQRPIRLQPLHSYATAGSVPKTLSSRQKVSMLEHNHHFTNGGNKGMIGLTNSSDYSNGISPYQLPIMNNYVIPVPPPPQKGDKNGKSVRQGAARGRLFRPTTAPNGLEQLLTKDSGKFHKPSLRSNASVTMIYLGKNVHLSHDDTDYRDEIKVYQQHCGGENLCIYKGKLLERETFQFTSKRHRGFPFSLTFFLNGIQVDRLSSCCEYKHRKGARLGGKQGYFGFVNVDRASPCYRCIIEMGLDKKPSPPKKEMKEDTKERLEQSMKVIEPNESSESSIEQKANKESTLVISSAQEKESSEDKMEIEEEERKEETRRGINDENDQENSSNYEYDEDFEADEEKSDEEVNEKGQDDDQMNGMSKSPSDDEKDNLVHEKESKSSSEKASDSEKDESDGYSDSDSKEGKQGEVDEAAICEKVAAVRKIQCFYRNYKSQQKCIPDRKSASPFSSSSTLYSSEDESEAEKTKDNITGNEKEDIEKTSDDQTYAQCENENKDSKPPQMEENLEMEADEMEMDETRKMEAEDASFREESKTLPESIMETLPQDTDEINGELKHGSIENNTREDGEEAGNNMREDGEQDVLVHLESSTVEAVDRNKEPLEVDEGGDCKSVQEKIAEAIENDYRLNSEPETSDSSTDEEEETLTSEAHDINEVPDGAFLAEGTRTVEIQKATEQMVQDGWMMGEKKELEEEEFIAEERTAGTNEEGDERALEEDTLSKKETACLMEGAVESRPAAKETVSEEEGIMKGDSEEIGRGKKQVSDGEEASKGNVVEKEDVNEREQEVEDAVSEGEEMVGEITSKVEEVVKMGEAMSEGDAAAEQASEEESIEEIAFEAVESVGMTDFAGKEAVREAAPDAEEAVEERDSLGKEPASEGDMAVETVCVGEEVESEKKIVEEATLEKAESAVREVAGQVEAGGGHFEARTASDGEEALKKAASATTSHVEPEGQKVVGKAAFAVETVERQGGSEEEKVAEKADFEGEKMESLAKGTAEQVGETEREAMEKAAFEGEDSVEKAGEVKETPILPSGQVVSEGETVEEVAFEGGEVVARAEAAVKVVARQVDTKGEVVKEVASIGEGVVGKVEFVADELVEAVQVPRVEGGSDLVLEAKEATLLGGEAMREESVGAGEVLLLEKAAKPEEPVGLEKFPMSETVSEVDRTAKGGEESGQEKEATQNKDLEKDPAVNKSAPRWEELLLDRETERETLKEGEAWKSEEGLLEASEKVIAKQKPEEEMVDGAACVGELEAEKMTAEREEVGKAGKEEMAKEADKEVMSPMAALEMTFILEEEVPVDEESREEAKINIGEVESENLEAEAVTMGGEGMSEALASEEAMAKKAAGSGKVKGNEITHRGEEMEGKSASDEKEEAEEALTGCEAHNEEERHEEGHVIEESGFEDQRVMTGESVAKEDGRARKKFPKEEKLMTKVSLRKEGEAVTEMDCVTEEMASCCGAARAEPAPVGEEGTEQREANMNYRMGRSGTEDIRGEIKWKQFDRHKIAGTEVTESRAENPPSSPGGAELLEVQLKEESPAQISTVTTGASIAEERNGGEW
ncbi:PREDICTED: glutamate-rich protein 3 isoform X1 [Gavialis gangeticus]|uniref:glutamate-rich protein 3 isoform X1 n=1 Tax=Gavialis gangeticus TaxID=94835 RepID=UPI00092E47C1|nr:PREDICTED: glutamate-rich protein 3 isoform X1 [Gavialis gangeticus]